MSLSYEFSIGSVRAKEKSLFNSSDVEQMLALKSENELIRFLRDKGYGDGFTVDEIIESNTQKMWKYIKGVAPDFDLFYPFFIQNDIHNLKTVLKGVMSEREPDELLIEPCSIKKEDMIRAVENRRFENFPLWLRRPANRAYQILAETKDARLSDAYIDKAVLSQLLVEGKKSGSEFLMEYFGTFVFYANVKAALRGARMTVRRLFYEKALCECDGLDKETVIRFAMQGHEALVKYLSRLDAYGCKKAMEAYAKSASEFEKFVDNRLVGLARTMCRLTSEGPEPLVGYYIGCVYERKMIYIIASGLKTEAPPEKIRERLRDIYG